MNAVICRCYAGLGSSRRGPDQIDPSITIFHGCWHIVPSPHLMYLRELKWLARALIIHARTQAADLNEAFAGQVQKTSMVSVDDTIAEVEGRVVLVDMHC